MGKRTHTGHTTVPILTVLNKDSLLTAMDIVIELSDDEIEAQSHSTPAESVNADQCVASQFTSGRFDHTRTKDLLRDNNTMTGPGAKEELK